MKTLPEVESQPGTAFRPDPPANGRPRQPSNEGKRQPFSQGDHPPSTQAGRQPSSQASQALKEFAELRRFFAFDAQLAKALAWDEATASQWRHRRVVRPQRIKGAQVRLLLQLCQEAEPYLDATTDVGDWSVAPLPNLGGRSPAYWLRGRGARGLRELVFGMVDWMPRVPERDLDPIPVDEDVDRLEGADDRAARNELNRMISELD